MAHQSTLQICCHQIVDGATYSSAPSASLLVSFHRNTRIVPRNVPMKSEYRLWQTDGALARKGKATTSRYESQKIPLPGTNTSPPSPDNAYTTLLLRILRQHDRCYFRSTGRSEKSMSDNSHFSHFSHSYTSRIRNPEHRNETPHHPQLHDKH